MGAVTPVTGSLAVSWTAPSSDGGSALTAYDLRQIQTSADETVDANWTVVGDVWATGGVALQHTLTGLTGGTQYDPQVRAVNAGGDGPWTATFGLQVAAEAQGEWGGQRINTRRKPAAWAAAAPMNVLPVPISPTTVVPRCAWRERAVPLMATSWPPIGLRSSRGSLTGVSESR